MSLTNGQVELPFITQTGEQKRYRFLRSSIMVIEGLIAAGKSTLCDGLVRYLTSIGIKAILFKEEINPSMLRYFLGDRDRHAFAMELYCTLTRIETYKLAEIEAEKGCVVIIDRSIVADIAFAHMQVMRGAITREEFDLLLSIIRGQRFRCPDVIIHLDCDYKVAYERMLKRDRAGESSSYDLTYFKDLDSSYRYMGELLKGHTQEYLKLDWNSDLEVVDDQVITSVLGAVRARHLSLE